MVHGNGRFLLMYELGVLGGAINWVLIAGGQGALVGCSGGVYAIFGMHTAELVMNWESNAKGIFSHWFRLLMIGFVLSIDTYLYYVSPTKQARNSSVMAFFLTLRCALTACL